MTRLEVRSLPLPYAFSLADASRHAGGVSVVLLRREIRAGRLRAARIGVEGSRHPRIVVRRKDLERWVDGFLKRGPAAVTTPRDRGGKFSR